MKQSVYEWQLVAQVGTKPLIRVFHTFFSSIFFCWKKCFLEHPTPHTWMITLTTSFSGICISPDIFHLFCMHAYCVQSRYFLSPYYGCMCVRYYYACVCVIMHACVWSWHFLSPYYGCMCVNSIFCNYYGCMCIVYSPYIFYLHIMDACVFVCGQ